MDTRGGFKCNDRAGGDRLMPAPVLDRHGNSSSSGGTTTTISVTTGAPDTLVLVTTAVGGTTTTLTPSLSISGGGLAWSTIGFPVSGAMAAGVLTTVQMWRAFAASQLTAQTITVTSTATIDDASSVYASFTGAYAASPIDPNAGAVVTTLHNTGGSAVPAGVFSSTNANDLCVIVQGCNQSTTATVSAPVSLIDSNLNSGGARYSYIALASQTFTAAQTSVSVGFTNSFAFWGFIGAMLTADVTDVPPTNAVLTQAALEQWGSGTPDMWMTQAAVEMWASVQATSGTSMVATQIALEMWARVASAVAAQPRVMILA